MARAIRVFRRAGRAPARGFQGAQRRKHRARGRRAGILLHRTHGCVPGVGAAAGEDHDAGLSQRYTALLNISQIFLKPLYC